MKKIRIKLNKVGLRGYHKGAIIEIDPNDGYWKRRLAECEGTDYIDILPDSSSPKTVEKSKDISTKSKPKKQES